MYMYICIHTYICIYTSLLMDQKNHGSKRTVARLILGDKMLAPCHGYHRRSERFMTVF